MTYPCFWQQYRKLITEHLLHSKVDLFLQLYPSRINFPLCTLFALLYFNPVCFTNARLNFPFYLSAILISTLLNIICFIYFFQFYPIWIFPFLPKRIDSGFFSFAKFSHAVWNSASSPLVPSSTPYYFPPSFHHPPPLSLVRNCYHTLCYYIRVYYIFCQWFQKQ